MAPTPSPAGTAAPGAATPSSTAINADIRLFAGAPTVSPGEDMHVDLEVANYDEIRVSIYSESDTSKRKIVAQKFVSDGGTDPDTTWDLPWMLEIGSFMYETAFLRQLMPVHIDLLGWTLYREIVNPSASEMVEILQTVLMNWLLLCAQDDTCLAVPHAKMAEDPDIRKLLNRIHELENASASASASASANP